MIKEQQKSTEYGAGRIDSAGYMDVAQVEGARAYVAKRCEAMAIRGIDLPRRCSEIRACRSSVSDAKTQVLLSTELLLLLILMEINTK